MDGEPLFEVEALLDHEVVNFSRANSKNYKLKALHRIPMQLSLKLAFWGPVCNWPRRESYCLTSPILYLTSRSTLLSDFLMFWFVYYLQKK
jgi:hypothetical protein